MPEIDFIYLINLKERPNKLKSCRIELNRYNIHPYRFNAINGWDLKNIELETLGFPNSFMESMTPGKIGCILSHLSVLKDAYESDYETVWILEDDIEVVQNPHKLPSLIQSLDLLVPDWDILYTDLDTKDYLGNRVACLDIYDRPYIQQESLDYYRRKVPINEQFVEIGMRYGCYSMIVRKSGIKKILRYFNKNGLFAPIDMELFFVPGLKQIALFNDVVSTKKGISSDTNYPLSESAQKTREFYLNLHNTN